MPSGLIRGADYDLQTRTLSVWLVTSENRHDYQGCRPISMPLLAARFRRDVFFNDHIRNHFEYHVVRENALVE